MVINDESHRAILRDIPDIKQSISYVISNLWIKIGFLPIDPSNPGTALIAEYFLSELVFKDFDSTDLENLDLG